MQVSFETLLPVGSNGWHKQGDWRRGLIFDAHDVAVAVSRYIQLVCAPSEIQQKALVDCFSLSRVPNNGARSEETRMHAMLAGKYEESHGRCFGLLFLDVQV
jgi:hypothetical protein